MSRKPFFWGSMLFALAFPTILTAAYFVLLADWSAGLQQAVYSAGKIVQFGFPAIFVFILMRRGRRGTDAAGNNLAEQELLPRITGSWRPSSRGIATGIGFGLLAMVVMFMLYRWLLIPGGFLGELQQQVTRKVSDLGIDSVGRYMAVGLFYALVHSLLEEYYWRWFVFGQLSSQLKQRWAILISSLGFMAHHVILLATFFGWLSPLTYVGAVGVAIGGAFWAWLYSHSRSLIGPWLSHMLIDAAIFLIGFDVIRQQLSGG